MSKKTQLIIIILVALIFFGLGYAVSFLKNRAPVNNNDTYKAGWDAARAKLIESGLTKTDFELRQLPGEIVEINGDKITLKVKSNVDPLADQSLGTRIIVVDSATKIYSLEAKDPKKYEAEIKAYNKLPQDKRPAEFPNDFKKTEISLSDLPIGRMILVSAENDIKEAKEFKATQIDYTKPATPIAAPAL